MSLFIDLALAAPQPCALINGCDAINVLPHAVTVIGQYLLDTVSALCVLMVIWGGIQMTFNNGDESAFKKGITTIQYAMIGLGVALLSQTIVNYAVKKGELIRTGAHANLLWNAIKVGIDTLIGTFNVAIVLVIIFAGFQYVLSRGSSDKAQSALKMVLWEMVGGIAINIARMLAEFVTTIGL